MADIKELLEAAKEIAYIGGQHTLKYFKKDFEVISKADDSPVTIADRETEQIIREEMDNLLSEGLKFHLKNKIRLNENIFRPGSDKYFELFAEVRKLSKNGLYKLDENEKYWINETDIGEFGIFEGKKVPLDFPM